MSKEIFLTNTLSRQLEKFVPLKKGEVSMYVCGVTPYDSVHLGHARCYVFFDVVKRTLRQAGYKVRSVQNFTDVDDKILARGAKENRSPRAVAEEFIADYFDKMRRINVLDADLYPRVTETIPPIIDFIERLIAKKVAYVSGGDVFYAVREFKSYGKLSGRDLESQRRGARVEINEDKADPLDFALWKTAKPGEESWDSPWGKGRPGWHIECSVMSTQNLGATFDIHGGGQDLIFPHHENEIAQSEAATGHPFARVWLHNAFVTINKEKMSKSLGNFFSLADIFAQTHPMAVRFMLLSRHYRTPLDFSDVLLKESSNAFLTLYEASQMADFLTGPLGSGSPVDSLWLEKFEAALFNDFNTEKALAVVFGLRNELIQKMKSNDLESVKKLSATYKLCAGDVLGFQFNSFWSEEQLNFLKQLLRKRHEARVQKNWKESDAIRDQIQMQGCVIEDTPHGAILKPTVLR